MVETVDFDLMMRHLTKSSINKPTREVSTAEDVAMICEMVSTRETIKMVREMMSLGFEGMQMRSFFRKTDKRRNE